jgi:predicted TIM-barrel fold metal-dependent hydrolase
MRIFDCHSHWATRKGYLFRTEEDLASQERIWKTKPEYLTEQQMAAYFRQNDVRTILDMGWISELPFEEMQQYHDYMIEVQRAHSDVIYGHWININPKYGKEAIREFERLQSARGGFVGFGIFGQGWGIPPSDRIWDPFYKASIDARVPVLLHTGITGIGQGMRGGKGILNDHAHPRHVDEVAARFPELDVLAARPAYPWQEEMIAVLLHKGNVMYELHGWSPKYLSESLKKEIGTRLQDRIMFGCDFPVLRYEKLIADWQSLGYRPEILEKVFHRNAESYFPEARRS